MEYDYLQRAVDPLRKQGDHPAPGDLAHLSPLSWEHINLTGDYHWDTSPTLGQINSGRSGPLPRTSRLLLSVL